MSRLDQRLLFKHLSCKIDITKRKDALCVCGCVKWFICVIISFVNISTEDCTVHCVLTVDMYLLQYVNLKVN
jgi:hypothetical protein